MKHAHHVLIRWPTRLLQGVAWLVIVCFTINTITPGVVGAKSLAGSEAPAQTDVEVAADTLVALEEIVDRLDRRMHGRFEYAWQEVAARASRQAAPAAARRSEVDPLDKSLRKLMAKLDSLQDAVAHSFSDDEARLRGTTSSVETLSRVQAQRANYDELHAQLRTLLANVAQASSDADYRKAIADSHAFLLTHSSKPKRAPSAPDRLAFGVPKERPRAPLTDPAELRSAIEGATSDTGKRNDKRRIADGVSAGAKTTALDVPADLAPTEDVQITEAIRAKATELHDDPLEIYQWVRNNIDFIPTYGSIQGSDYALRSLRGNAFDQASLLIALLRAGGVHARYVYGTIEVPIDQVMNWVGGVTSANAALELFGQGGIPVVGVTEGGIIKRARLEHVWVEARVAYSPARAGKAGLADTWIALDPSFKQYDQTPGLDVAGHVAVNTQEVADHLNAAATSNPAEGWVQGIDTQYMYSRIGDYASRVSAYVSQQSPTATNGDVFGVREVHAQTLPYLPAGLAAAKTISAMRYDALPDTLRWKFQYVVDEQTLLSSSLPVLSGHRMALAFAPAGDSDRRALEAYVPASANPNDLPAQLPANSIAVRAEFALDERTTATGRVYGIGSQLQITERLYQPGRGWSESYNELTAGDYQAVAIDGGSRAQSDIATMAADMQRVRDKLDRQDYAGISRHELLGRLLQNAALSYFTQTAIKTDLAARGVGMAAYRLPSYGTVSAASSVSYFFGVPRSYKPNGLIVDMDRMAFMSVAKTGDSQRWKAFNSVAGSIMSAQENATLEELFNTPTLRQEGASAVRALAKAMQAGQRIYSLDGSNVGSALASIDTTPEVKQEIADAVDSGLHVLVHQNPVSFSGHAVTGYVILDPATGAGAYKISTGDNGGAFWFVIALFAIAMAFTLGALLAAIASGAVLLVLGAIWALYWLIDAFSDWVDRIGQAQNSAEFNQASFMAALQALMGFIPYAFLEEMAGALAAALFGDAFIRIWDCAWYNGSLPWCLF